jgi:hypothetical protein
MAATASPAKRAPAKAITPVQVDTAEDTPAAAGETEEMPTAQILFKGRKLTVVMPTPSQLAVWDGFAATSATAGKLDPKSEADNAKAAKILSRSRKLIKSLLADDDDMEWVDDELLNLTLTLQDTLEILTLTNDAFRAQQKTAAPKTGPAPRARRRRQ